MTETWKPVVGFESVYEVSDHGHVRSVRVGRYRGRVLRPLSDKCGYQRVTLYRHGDKPKCVRIHRLVLDAFVPTTSERNECDHINRDGSDNRLVNLRWVTRTENVRTSSQTKINENQLRLVCHLYLHHGSACANILAPAWGVHTTSITHAARREARAALKAYREAGGGA